MPVTCITILFCIGILASQFIKTPVLFSFIGCISCLILAAVCLKNKILFYLALSFAILAFGIASYQVSNILPPNHISRYTPEAPEKIILRGVITDDPVIGSSFYGSNKISFLLNTNSFNKDGTWESACGIVKADVYSAKPFGELHFGDEVALAGSISRPVGLKNPGLFDYSKYLNLKNIYSVIKVGNLNSVRLIGCASRDPIKRLAYDLKRKMAARIDMYLLQPDNGFIKAILIGDRSGLKKSLEDEFIKTGTVHILSISGTHVGLIACVLLFIFGVLRIPRKINIISTSLFLIFYSIIAGSSPPIVRAVIMFTIAAIGYLINRDADILNSFSVAAFLILLYNPKELFDPSFQLSFASIISIIVLTPKVNSILMFKAVKGNSFFYKIRYYVLSGVSVSIAAWAGVAPIVSYYFNIVSPIAIVANLAVIPLISLSMIISFAFLFVSTFSDSLASYLAAILQGVDGLAFQVNHILSQIRFAYFRLPAPTMVVLIIYYLLLALVILPEEVYSRKIRLRKKYIVIAILLYLNISIWSYFFNSGKDPLKVTFLDVGQGDSTLVEFPGNGCMLIDGGSGGDEERFDTGKTVVAPYLWNKGIARIDAIVVTHPHADHLGGVLYILRNFRVGCVIDNGFSVNDSRICRKYNSIIKRKGIRRIVVKEGDEIEGFKGARILILNPERREDDGPFAYADAPASGENENSLVLKLIYGRSSILFCGDINNTVVERLSAYPSLLKSDILKVPHHGGYAGNELQVKNFFETVSPEVSVISAGATRYHFLPSQKILQNSNFNVYRTSDSGAITAFLDGADIKVKPFIKKN